MPSARLRKRISTMKNFVLSLAFNFVSAPPNGFDVFWIFKGIIHLFTQMSDMHRNGVVAFTEIFFAPDTVEQFFRTDYLSLFLTKDIKNCKFRRCQG